MDVKKLFAYEHLPPHLQEVSEEFYKMADFIEMDFHDSAEKTLALRKLWEAKNLMVFAAANASE